MKSLMDFLEFSESEEDYFHIIVIISDRMLLDHSTESLLNEGQWKPSDEKGYWVRVDNPHFEFERRHVHIAQQKHINAKNMQVAWNDDGSRHDKKSFNNNFKGMERAKDVARKSLGLDNSVILEALKEEDRGSGLMLLESIETLPASSSVIIFEARRNTSIQQLLLG